MGMDGDTPRFTDIAERTDAHSRAPDAEAGSVPKRATYPYPPPQ
jgi:hypothetical protein